MLLLTMLLGCGGSTDDGVPPDTDTDTDTGSTTIETGDTGTTSPTPGPVDCEARPDNRLRYDCTVALDASDAAAIEVWPVSGEAADARVFSSDAAATDHTIGVWFLRPQTAYEVRAVDGAGAEVGRTTFTTDELPGGVALDAQVTGVATAEGILVAPNCPVGWLFVLDGEGEVIWYQEVSAMLTGTPAPLTGLSYTEDGTVLVTISKTVVAEIDWSGQVLLDLRREVDFDHYVHHDLFRKDGLTYALFATMFDDGTDQWVLDGVYALDSAGVVDSFDIQGLFPLQESPFDTVGYWSSLFADAHDYSHANSVFVGDDGDLLVSFRHLHAVARFTGGPGAPGYGDLQWLAVGRDDSVVAPGDLIPTGSPDPGFGGQHHATWGSDGALWMFDNGWDFDETARGVRYAVDLGSGTLTELESWETDRNCPIQGSAYERPGGGVMVTCSSAGWAGEYAAGDPSPVFELQLSCGSPIPVQIPRAIPIDVL